MSIIKAINDDNHKKMTLLMHFLEYWLHLSEITNTNTKNISDVRYVSIYRNIDIFVEYRDTILAFGCIDTLEWTV